MEVELIEISQFLAGHNPFSYLTEETLNKVTQDMEIQYLRRGSTFPPIENFLYVVRSGAIELRNQEGALCEKLAEGSIYSTTCQLVNLSQCERGEAVEDTLLYLLPCDRLKALCRESEDFNHHFSASVKDRLKVAVNRMQASTPMGEDASQMMVEVGQLINKPAISVTIHGNIRETAALMTENGVSSVMVLDGSKVVGLVTDADMRKRCVATGVDTGLPITKIMTANPTMIEHNMLSSQAMMVMTRLHAHHLPVLRHGELLGMITANDLAKSQSANSAFLATDIRKAQTLDDLVRISRQLPDLQVRLAVSNVPAKHVGEALSSITDSITVRLLEIAEAELGDPPVAYCWLAGGSQGRQEQTSHSDQDNALIFGDSFQPEHDEYFAALARFVSDGLNLCGFVYCPGNAMVTNPKWRQPLATWKRYFDHWITSPDPQSLMLASIFFDLRPVHGNSKLFHELQSGILRQTQTNHLFLAHMMANALKHRPPLGFFRQFVLVSGGKHDETLDLKHRGIVPITDIARIMALAKGLPEVNTAERLEAAAEAGMMTAEMDDNLDDAYEFIAALRIKHQAGLIRMGQKPDNYLVPENLSELERGHLKDAFRIIQTMQETLAKRYQADRIG